MGTIQMAGTEMMRVANLSTMEVQVDVSENDIVRVKLGQEVDIEVDAYLGHTFKGVVTEIANSASNISTTGISLNTDQVTNFLVKIRVNSDSYAGDQKYPFRPGMSASVDIKTNMVENIVSVPIQAVTAREKDDLNKDGNAERKDEDFDEVVFVVSGDTVMMTKVKTGIQDDEFIQIISGLENDQKIVKGPYAAISSKLDDGSQIHEKKDKEKKEKKD